MKLKFLAVAALAVGLLAACGSTEATDNAAKGEEDVVTTASIVNEADAFVNAVSEDGTWIIATLNDLTIDEEVVVAGEFHDKNDEANDIYRKIALYTQDADHNITDSFTLTVPKLTVQSENLRIQGGTVVGDIYVEANGFNLDKTATVEGTIFFANEEVEASAVIDGKVSAGEKEDVVTTASLVNEDDAFVKAVSEDGTWIIATLNDITIDEEVVVAGEFYDKNDEANGVFRKIGLYTQDADHNITANFNLTLPKLIVQSENLRIQGGTVIGDIYVEANGFNLHESATIEGNIFFANEEVEVSAVIEGKVNGTVGVQ